MRASRTVRLFVFGKVAGWWGFKIPWLHKRLRLVAENGSTNILKKFSNNCTELHRTFCKSSMKFFGTIPND